MPGKINKIKLKEAETNNEKVILGLIDEESKRIGYGKIILELTVVSGEVKNIQVVENRRSIKLA